MSMTAEIARLPSAWKPSSNDGLSQVSRAQHGSRELTEIGALATQGGVYLTLRYGLSIVISIGNMFLLTRWIGPHAYGLFVTAVGLTAFLASLTRFGVDTYLVRCDPAPDRRQYDVAFTLVLTSSVLLCGGGLAIVPLLKTWYSGDEFALPYLVLLLCVPLTGLAGIPTAKLERALNFSAVAAIELGGQGIAFVIAGILAWHGFGVWAPVTGMFAWQVFALLAACTAAQFLPHLRLRAPDAGKMLAFGFGYSASMRVWQLRSLVNPLFVGRIAGTEAVALVGLALRVAEGIGFVRTAAGRLAIAALARVQSDRPTLRRALERALTMQVLILGPLLCAFAVCGPWLVPRAMGSRWAGVVSVYPLIAIGVLVSSVSNLQASTLFVLGKQWTVLLAYACHVILLTLGTWLLLPRLGMMAYGWAEVLACTAYVVLHLALKRVISISYRAVLPWLAVFGALLTLPVTTLPLIPTTTILCAIVLSSLGWKILGRDFPSSTNEKLPRRSAAQRIHGLLAKTRSRGWRYLLALARFQWSSLTYRILLSANRARSTVTTRKSRRNAGCVAVTMKVIPIDRLASNLRFHFGPADIPRIAERIPDSLRERTVSEADQILAHHFCFRSREESMPQVINWDNCPEGSLSWQWDLNRHRFFLTLAFAYHYTQDLRYICKMVELWQGWIRANPVGEGRNWKYAFEVAARLQNWLWAYFLLAYSPFSKNVEMEELTTAIQRHALHVAAHLEYHWPNNHLLLETKAVHEFALLFPYLDPGNKLLRRSGRLLEREVMKQVLPDGSHAELCSMYHRIVAGELLELLLLSQRLGHPLTGDLERRIRSMSDFSRAMMHPDGSMPLLGDSAAEDTYLRFESNRFECSDMNYWLQPDRHESNVTIGSRDLHVFWNAGYAFLRDVKRNTHVTFDFGQLSRCETANHAHSDALSFELWANGQQLLIDPGVYLPWNDENGWTRYFRGTNAHNTLEIDGRPQSELSESFEARTSAHCKLVRQAIGDEGIAVTAECVPFWARENEIRHRREICLQGEQLRIRDQVEGSGVRELAWSFQFAPGVDLTYQHDLLRGSSSAGRKLLVLALAGQQRPRLELFCGHQHPLRGWISRNSSQVIPAPLARYSIRTNLPCQMEFTIHLLT